MLKDICESNRDLTATVKRFIENVQGIKEESITDFLIWQWRELDKRFRYLSVTSFSREAESTTTGADFDLELWLVGRTTYYSLAVQAKKFLKQHDSYVSKLRYPNRTKKQMDTLLSYASANNKLPFYFIYSAPEFNTKTMCKSEGGVFMADAKTMEYFADGKHGKSVSRDALLAKSNPFHCLFCCPLSRNGRYFQRYFPHLGEAGVAQANESLPDYVRQLLDAPSEESSDSQPENHKHWKRFRAVGVYDLRDIDFQAGPRASPPPESAVPKN